MLVSAGEIHSTKILNPALLCYDQMAQTIPYLVARALDNGKAADVHRVYAVRQAVPMFDFADERWACIPLKAVVWPCKPM
jgi:hypothetical protein